MTGFTYKSYNFVDKDPMIDQVRTIIIDSHNTYKQIAELSGVNEGTIRNWLDGAVKRPQAATLNAVLRALGYKLTIRLIAETETIAPTIAMVLPQYKKENMRHVVQMAKYRRAK
jgi:transcriptional regulator with XRE-family HTH domain